MNVVTIERILETYTLEEILEFNELTEADILYILVRDNILKLPSPKPIDFEDE